MFNGSGLMSEDWLSLIIADMCHKLDTFNFMPKIEKDKLLLKLKELVSARDKLRETQEKGKHNGE